ncbi:hypothetical protein BDR04DRAFT_1116975 [Suillus decipiens]|nr:hypothetical protein BDR04DRAFT_1116975 [Suillus decipiens]
MKAGRKVKAHATNIIDAVLQEQEAYSKLYYCDCIKSTMQEKLTAVSKKLTSGKHVALIKKETAVMYANETPEVKAHMKEFLEEQKQQRVQMKEEGPWSKLEGDYLQNLDKLAAITNKFLKGLADATGMSFLLLAGGLSPEAQRHIYMYSIQFCSWYDAATFFTSFEMWDPTPMTPSMVPDDLISNASPHPTLITLSDECFFNISSSLTLLLNPPTMSPSTALLDPPTMSLSALLLDPSATSLISLASVVTYVVPGSPAASLTVSLYTTSIPLLNPPTMSPSAITLPDPSLAASLLAPVTPTLPTATFTVSATPAMPLKISPGPVETKMVVPVVPPALGVTDVDTNTAGEDTEAGYCRTSHKSKLSTCNNIAKSIGGLGKENIPPKLSAKHHLAEGTPGNSTKSKE